MMRMPPPVLQVRISPTGSVHDFVDFPVNDDTRPFVVNTPLFTGYVTVRIKNYQGQPTPLPYFTQKKRAFSIQVEGRFHHTYSANDVMLAADFEKPLKPPFGSSIMVEFVRLIDPALEVDLHSKQPKIQSPIMCAMNMMRQMPVPAGLKPNGLWPWRWGGQAMPLEEGEFEDPLTGAPISRRKFYLNVQERSKALFRPDMIYSFDWFSPFVDWNTFDLQMGLKLNALRYLNGQPVRFSLRTRDSSHIFFTLEFKLIK